MRKIQRNSGQLDAKLTEDREKKYFVYPGPPEQTSVFDLFSPHSGVHSFARLPYSRDLNGIDIAIYGMPLHQTTTNRSGARKGPAAIRRFHRVFQ